MAILIHGSRGNALFSPCRRWRYTLWREWSFENANRYVNFVCLNPSTADADKDDNTIRKCIKFAKAWEFGRVCITNLFAWRSTDPSVLKTVPDPIGVENDEILLDIANSSAMVIAAWGRHGNLFARARWFQDMYHGKLHILRMGNEAPWHPLYLPDSTTPMIWSEKK